MIEEYGMVWKYVSLSYTLIKFKLKLNLFIN